MFLAFKMLKWTATVPPRSSEDPYIHFVKTVPTSSKWSGNKKTFPLKIEMFHKTQMGEMDKLVEHPLT